MKKFFALSAVVGAIILAGCGRAGNGSDASSANEILIGEYGSLSGGNATFGQSTHKGIELAMEEINAGGGVLGKKIHVITEDDQGKPDQAATVVQKLIHRDNVVAVLGEVASSRSLAAAPICQAAKVPMLSPSSTAVEVTQTGDYIFRACFIDPFQGSTMAKFAFDNLKIRKAAVLIDTKNDYSVGLSKFFIEKFTALGGTIVAKESYQADDKEFKPQLTNIRAAKPEAVFVPGYYTEAALIARQARELGLDVPLMGGDGWDSDVLVASGGQAVEGCYFSTHYHPGDPRPEVRDFVEKFKQKYGSVPDSMAVTGYDAANLLFDAIVRAGKIDSTAIRDALAQTKDFAGVAGKISIDKDRNALKSLVVLKIENGQFTFNKLVEP